MLTPHWNLGGTRGCGLFAQLTETCVTLLTTEFLYYPMLARACPLSWGTLLVLAHALPYSVLPVLRRWESLVSSCDSLVSNRGSAAGI